MSMTQTNSPGYFEGFQYNHAQRRQDAVFGVTHPTRRYLGTFYASAFKSLFL